MTTSPFHIGERTVQRRLGVRDEIEPIGQRVIRDHMTPQQRAFYGQLSMLLLGAFDQNGRLWTSPLFGVPGFISTPEPDSLCIAARPLSGDPLAMALAGTQAVGVLGIEPHSRRRSRLSGMAVPTSYGLNVKVQQTFNNCPKHIRQRELRWVGTTPTESHPVTRLNGVARALIERADTFFIATQHAGPEHDRRVGGDVSHRGGRVGFVTVETDRSLLFPDYPGNRFFSTLGNLHCDPRAGLLFPDFERGDLLYLTGNAEVLWNAMRRVRFSLSHGYLLPGALPLRSY